MNDKIFSTISSFFKRIRSSQIMRIAMIVFCMSVALPSKASHIVGGELYYTCLGDDQFRVTLTVYRDCLTGIAPFDDPAFIGIYEGDTDMFIDTVEFAFNPAINDTFFIEEVNPCLTIDDDVCIHRTIYVDTISLPFRSGGYTLAYQRCCRNQAIVNIIEPTETGATYPAFVSETALLECNNSPRFNNFPPIFVCLNRPINYDHSAQAPDGDSLVYRMCTPYLGATQQIPRPRIPELPLEEVTFSTIYSEDDMLGNPDDPLQIDPVTGLLTGTPAIKGQFVVGICVDEYRDGVFLSTTRRDFQYVVGECVEITAAIGNANVQCDDLNVEFINNSLDATEFLWNFGDPANPNASSTLPNPSYIYPDTGEYTVTLISQPGDACSDTLMWILDLNTSTVEPNFNFQVLKCEEGVEIVVDNLSTDPDNIITDYLWEVTDGTTTQTSTEVNPSFTILGTDDVTVTLFATASDGCTQSFSQVVSPNVPDIIVQTDIVNACEGDLVELFSNGPDLSTLNYDWTPDDNLSDPNVVNPTFIATDSEVYTLTITADGSACSAQFIRDLTVSDIQDANIDATLVNTVDGSTVTISGEESVIVCNNETVTLSLTEVNTSINTYSWTSMGNPVGATTDTQIIVNPDEGTTTYTIVVTDAIGCTATDQITVINNPVNVQIDELTGVTTNEDSLTDENGDGILDMCPNDVGSLNVTNLDNDDILTYTWTGDTGLITDGIDTSNPTITANQPNGTYTLFMTATNQDGCAQVIEVMIEINGIPPIDIDVEFTDLTTNETVSLTGVDTLMVCGEETALLTLTSTTTLSSDVSYTWFNSEGEVVGVDGDLLSVTPNGTERYCAVVTNSNGCTAETCIVLTGGPVEVVVEETDDDSNTGSDLTDIDGDGILDLCVGNTSSLTVTSTDPTDINTYLWTGDAQILDDPTSPTPQLTSDVAGVFTLFLESTNQYDCTANDTVTVEVHDLPVIDIDATITDQTTNTVTTITGEDEILSCDDGLIVLTTTGVSTTDNNVQITWTNSEDGTIEDGGTITVDPDGSVTYTVMVTDEFGCMSTSQITINGSPVDITIAETTTDTDGDGFPDADVNADGSLDLCLDEVFQFNVTNNDPNQTVEYQWSASDPSITIFGANSSNPGIQPSVPGDYEIYLETTNQYTCSQTDVIPITVLFEAEPASFTSVQECIGLTINFSTTNPNYEYYTWFFGDVDNSSVTGVQNPTFTYTEPGTYNVFLVPLEGIDCGLDAVTQQVVVDDSVVEIGFTYEITNCTPDEVTIQFTDQSNTSQGEIVEWIWDFGTQGNSMEQNPTLVVTENVTFPATLTISNDTECDGTTTQEVIVVLPDLIDFPDDLVLCSDDDPIELNPNPNPDYEYTWDNGLIGANPAVAPTETTTYNVTVSNNAGTTSCVFEQSVTVQVSDAIGLGLDVSGSISGPFVIDETSDTNTITTCEDEQITITTTTQTGQETDYTWVWDPLVNGTTEITVGVDGNVTHCVTVTDELGCQEVACLTVQGGPVDIEFVETSIQNEDGTGNVAVLNGDGTIDMCLGTEFTFEVNNLDSNDTLSYVWTGDPIIVAGTDTTNMPTLNPTEAGVYEIILTTTTQYGCEQIDTIPVTVVDPNRVLDFDFVKECDGITINFTNNGDPVFDYIWTIGGVATPDPMLFADNITYMFPGVGTFDVTLAYDVNLACFESATEQVSIFDPILTAAYSYELIECSPDSITILFTDQSLNPDNNTVAVNWEINGEMYTGSTVELTFTEDQTFDIMQMITTANGCMVNSATETVEIDLIDDIQLIDDEIIYCQNDEPVELNPNGNPDYVYIWSPSQGLSCNNCPNPTANPTETTLYTVEITNINGIVPCTIVRDINIVVPDFIDLTLEDDFTTDCVDEATLTVEANLDNLTYEWFENDSTTPFSTATAVDVTPSGPVTYTVVATDPASGCTESESVNVIGSGINISAENPAYFCQGDMGEIMITNNDPNDTLVYVWEGDGILSGDGTSTIIINTETPSEIAYNVTITNQFGCELIENITAVILDEPTAPAVGQCEGLTITFNTEGDFNTPYYIWDFGDGTPTETGLSVPVTHTYAQTGDYTVTVTLPNGEECGDDIVLDITVDEAPNGLAAFDVIFDSECSDIATVNFTDVSFSGNGGDIVSWDWDFGAYGTSTEQNPTIDVDEVVIIPTTLIVTTSAGCMDTVETNVPIAPIDLVVELDDIQDCIDLPTELNPNPVDGYTFEWEDPIGNEINPEVVVTGDETYTVTITDDTQGCTSIQEVNVTNHPLIDISFLNGNTVVTCMEMDVVLTANTSPVDEIIWSTSVGGEIGSGSSITVSTGDGSEGAVVYTATATDEFGCMESADITVENDTIVVDFFLPQELSCLPGESIDAVQTIPSQQSENDNLTYVWSGGPIASGEITDAPVFNPDVTTVYNVDIANDNCTTEESVEVVVSQISIVLEDGIDADPDTIYLGNSVDLSVALGDYTYTWDDPNGGGGINPDDMNNPNITVTPTEAGDIVYTVTVLEELDEGICENILSVTIIVLERTCEEPFIFFPNAFSPNGDGENETIGLRYNPAHVTEASWAVYNRWGQKIFETDDLDGQWDGTFKGEELPPDVFGFWLRAVCTDGQEFHKQGNITLLK